MRTLAVLALIGIVGTGARAEQVTFPLVIDYPILAAALVHQLHPDPDGAAVLWGTRSGCRSLVVRDLHVDRAERLRLTARGKARVGFGVLGLCVAPLSWDGYLETLATPELGRDWQLRFGDLDSHVYDDRWRKTVVASRLWDVVKGRFERELAGFSFDLGPPVDEARALLRAVAEPERARPVLQALDTIRPLSTEAAEDAIRVVVAIDLPPQQFATGGPEPALAPMQLERWQAALESWDAFLVFVIKQVGMNDADPKLREELLALLLDSRERLLAALAAEPPGGVDPVRQLFLDAWERLRRVVREAALHGDLGDRALRYAAFLAAGDALAALDVAGPSLGLEISADGLRRLARILDPEYAGDPVAYSETPDAVLRDLFEFHDPGAGMPSEPPPSDGSWFGPRAAYAEPVDEIRPLVQRLDRWVPRQDDIETYRDAVARLLAHVTERTAQTNSIEPRFGELYRHLVATTAWQESCWRQFVEKDGKVTFLLSSTGDIGIMQVNRRVWRGFFDLQRLEWDVAYNAGAGAEILAQLLRRYGVREAGSRLENAARATYAAYNGGPEAYRRYRVHNAPRAQRAIDRAFWDKYQAMAAGQALDFVLCVENWGPPGRARLSTASDASTRKCCTSSRSSPATSTIERRHASIASRPRASFV
jgi:hypothetical protein